MKPTILIIEDDHAIRNNVLDILELEGFSVLEAENGGIGLGLLQTHQPDLILCDINMPDFDGYQILKFVRAHEPLTKTVFLFLTAMTDRNMVRQGMDMGADDYLTKPFTDEELVSAIRSRLNRHATLTTYTNEELETAKKQLSQLVAHELKTPLTSLVMIEQLISSKIETLSKEQIQDLLDSWKSGAHRLHHLVEQMVLMTQIDSGVLNVRSIKTQGLPKRLATVLESAIGVARQFAYRHPHGRVETMNEESQTQMLCDERSLRHALAEIVSNALDFSPEGTTVSITVNAEEDTARITITDNGPGLTTRRLKRALLPFHQIDRHKQEQQGMGLGLPIAKKIIELHDGNILFKKVASGGTQVIIELPSQTVKT
ncbi:MAG: hybrid sensor histidine kinase/response regulator [Chloroflexota bacterium]